MYVCNVCMHGCMYVCMHAVYMCICVYMYMCICICICKCKCIPESLPERPVKKAERRTNLWMLTLLELETMGYNNWTITTKYEQTQQFEPLFRLYVCQEITLILYLCRFQPVGHFWSTEFLPPRRGTVLSCTKLLQA